MKENDFSFADDRNNLESINLPTFSYCSAKHYIKKKIKLHKKNDKDDLEELTILKTNNNNDEVIDLDAGPDIEAINKIMTFNKKYPIDEEKKLKEVKFGRKKKNSNEEGKHNKYSGDNIIRKCKGVLLHHLYVLINNIIADNYKYKKGYDEKKNRLLKINQFQITNSDVDYNKSFLNKKLKDIFSENITQRCSTYNLDHNRVLINSLLKDEDENKRNLFNTIFNLTFMDCLEHFRGTKHIKELDNLIKYEDVCKNFEEDEDYLYSFKYYIDNYEKIMTNKKSRKKKKQKEQQNKDVNI